jgi:transposase InsO family protein
MGPEQECVTATYPLYVLQTPTRSHILGVHIPVNMFFWTFYIVAIGLTKGTTFPFYLILVDAYSRYACIYRISDKSSECVIDALTCYQADHGHIGNYGYLDIARVRADSGSQFTSTEFKKHCWEAGIQLSLAAP